MADEMGRSDTELQEEIRMLTKERERLQKKEATLLRDLEAAKKAQDTAREEAKSARQDAESARSLAREAVDIANVAQLSRSNALETAEEAVRRQGVAEDHLREAEAQLARKSEAEELSKMEREARTGLRDFVRDSLADIMMGVDDAATLGRCREVQEGLASSGFVSPSRIGDIAPEGKTEVQFDLALIANAEAVESRNQAREVEGEISGSILQVLGLTAKVSAGGSTQSGSETRDSTSQHNRIRFSVPVVFASQADKLG